MAWNREHAGVAAAPAVAIDWSVIAMTESAARLAVAGAWDLHRVAAAVGETVWWVTLVDATLVRYHPRDYETALASKDVRRRKTEGTLEGLRYVRNQLGKSVEPDEFVCPAVGDDGAGGWAWRPLPEPGLEALVTRARQWELSRYRAYQGRLAGRDIARTFARCTEFLAQAAGLVVGGARPGPHDPRLPTGGRQRAGRRSCRRSTMSAPSSTPPLAAPASGQTRLSACVTWRDRRRPRARAVRYRARASQWKRRRRSGRRTGGRGRRARVVRRRHDRCPAPAGRGQCCASTGQPSPTIRSREPAGRQRRRKDHRDEGKLNPAAKAPHGKEGEERTGLRR
jgi:hypothetical protein